jgi:hypothetical protein
MRPGAHPAQQAAQPVQQAIGLACGVGREGVQGAGVQGLAATLRVVVEQHHGVAGLQQSLRERRAKAFIGHQQHELGRLLRLADGQHTLGAVGHAQARQALQGVDQAAQPRRGFGGQQQAGKRFGGGLHRLSLAARLGHRLTQGGRERRRTEWLREHRMRAGLAGGGELLRFGVGRHEHEGQVLQARQPQQLLAQLQAIHAGHAPVAQHQIHGLLPQQV